MKHLLEFESWNIGFAKVLNEQQTGTDKGFIAVIGSTDTQNLSSGSANPIGIQQDTTTTLKMSGVEEMIKIGAAKKFENVTNGKKVKAGMDYLTITADGKKYTMTETGSIKVPFNNSTVLEVEGAGNGLLALLRALHYLNVAVTKNSFDYKFPFEGIMMIKIGEVTRKGMGLSVNGKYDQASGIRISTGYKDLVKTFITPDGKFHAIKEALSADQKPDEIQNSSADQIVVSGDSIADGIKAAHFLRNKTKWKSQFSSFHGFKDMMSLDGDEPPAFYLAVVFQYCLAGLSNFYPMDLSKIYKVDLQPYGEKIVKAQPQDLKNFDPASIKTQILEMLKIYQPKTLKDYPEFDEVLPKYWDVLSNAVVNRILREMPKTYTSAISDNSVGPAAASTGGIGTGGISHGSGKIDN
jgi:hypothetical protein